MLPGRTAQWFDEGWLEVTRGAGVIKVNVRIAVRDEKGKQVGEKEAVIEEREVGVRGEIASWLGAIEGSDDGIDGPRGTLVDVAFIQAALNSGGAPVDLEKLARV